MDYDLAVNISFCAFSQLISVNIFNHQEYASSSATRVACFRPFVQTGVINLLQSHPVPWLLVSHLLLPLRCATNHLCCLSLQRQWEDNGSFSFGPVLSAVTLYLQDGNTDLMARSNVCCWYSMIIDAAVMGKSLTHVGVTEAGSVRSVWWNTYKYWNKWIIVLLDADWSIQHSSCVWCWILGLSNTAVYVRDFYLNDTVCVYRFI